MSRSCLVPLMESDTTGAIAADDSELNVIGAMFDSNVTNFTPSFEILFHVADRLLELYLRENITLIAAPP